MDLHERQQLDFLLAAAVERFVERLEQRNEGAVNALTRLRCNPHHESVRLYEFVDAFFADFLLDNPDGSGFILRGLARRKVPAFESEPAPLEGTIGDVLQKLAVAAFAELLKLKSEEVLEQHVAYGSLEGGDA